VAGELQRYLRLLSGAEIPIVTEDGGPAGRTLILVGGPDVNPLVGAAMPGMVGELQELKEEGFILRTARTGSQDVLIVAGRDEAGTMYAAYDLLERLGVVFTTTRDIIPERKPDLVLAQLGVRYEPALRYRGHHLRHVTMPWMSADYLCGYLDQLAKMKCNYVEFFWYEGAPWVEYAHRGEKRLIGDVYPRESGYISWRLETYGFGGDDVLIGREFFAGRSPFAPEFQECATPEEAHRAARGFLTKVIEHAHQRKIGVWLGAGDCPYVPPNLRRFSRRERTFAGMGAIMPGDPAGVEVWSEILSSMITTYPQADGYWLWLAETYLSVSASDAASRVALEPVERYRPLLPDGQALRKMGYDAYVASRSDEELASDALLQLYFAKTVTERVRSRFPQVRLGVSLLGRSYLFPALQLLLPKDIALQSMEASICWNRQARVPMENFAAGKGRDMFLVPRLDDDENELAAQFHVTLYGHDRVSNAPDYGITGVAPQVGKTRGLEHNARFLADAAWSPGLTPAAFYKSYVKRLFGQTAADPMAKAYQMLEATDMFLGLEVPSAEVGYCFTGIDNFRNYGDSRDIEYLKQFRYSDLFSGPVWPDWNVTSPGEAPRMKQFRFRTARFLDAIQRYEACLDLLRHSRPAVPDGSRPELEYLIYKTESFVLHLRVVCALMSGHAAYDAAYRAKYQGRREEAIARFDECVARFGEAAALAEATAVKIASGIDDPTDRHILFRYNVRFVLPIREFQKYIRNVTNYHAGLPYWETPNWSIIDPPWPPM
jgi:hypothetical protein